MIPESIKYIVALDKAVLPEKGYTIITTNGNQGILCWTCEMASYHPKDIEHKYCGCCHKFHPRLLPQQMPSTVKQINACTECDMLIGPCACGATHEGIETGLWNNDSLSNII